MTPITPQSESPTSFPPRPLAKGIEFFIAHPEKREKMGNMGRKIAAMYGSDSMVQMIDKLYGELLREK